MPFPLALGILGAAAVSAVGSALQNRRAEVVARRNAEQQRQWQLEDRAHEEAYNDPQAQLARLRAAGINPMNSGSIGVGESAVPNAPAIESVDYRNPGEDIAQGINSLANYQVQQQDLELRRDQLELDKRKIDSDIRKQDSEIEVNKTVQDLNKKLGVKTQQEANAIGEQFKKLVTENKYYDENLRNQLRMQGIDINSKELEYKFNYDTLNDRMENLRASNKKIWKEIDEIGSRIGLNNQMKDYWYSKTKEMNELLAHNFPYWQAVSMKNEALKGGIAYKTMIIGYQYQLDTMPIQQRILEYQGKGAPYDALNKENQSYISSVEAFASPVKTGAQVASDVARTGFYLYGVKNMRAGKPLIQTSPTTIHTSSPMSQQTVLDIYGKSNYNGLGTIFTSPVIKQ